MSVTWLERMTIEMAAKRLNPSVSVGGEGAFKAPFHIFAFTDII